MITLNQMNDIKRTILIVEDNKLNQDLLDIILSSDYTLKITNNGREGLDFLKEEYHDISLIVLDVQMPVMNGYEFLEEFKKYDDFQQIPIIVTTGGEEQDEEKCLTLGATDFVTKPYNPQILKKRIEGLIGLSESIQIIQQTKLDKLTGLYSKYYFSTIIPKILEYSGEKKFGMIVTGISNYKRINELYGERTSLKILEHFGNVFRSIYEDNIYVSRFKEDKFVTIFELDNFDEKNYIETLKQKFYKNDLNIPFNVKFSVNIDFDKSLPIEVLVNNTTYALEFINNSFDEDVIYFEDHMLENDRHKYLIEDHMEEALLNEEFKVYYQPKHDTKTHKLVGAEALVRWVSKDLGFVSPGAFIPVFEENNFIQKLDDYIFKHVCQDIKKWENLGLKVVPVSINLSRRDLVKPNLVKDIDEYTKKININRDYIHFELTESVCGDINLANQIMNQIKSLGFKIEIDDFGSGYSSLGMITDIPMDYLKIDISFAKNIVKQKEIIRTVIILAHALGAKTVAEGVENEEQLSIYNELDCDCIQGYYFSKPIPKDEFEEYLKKEGVTNNGF